MLFIHDVDATSSRCALPNPPAAFRQQRPVLMRATGSLLFVLSVGVFFYLYQRLGHRADRPPFPRKPARPFFRDDPDYSRMCMKAPRSPGRQSAVAVALT